MWAKSCQKIKTGETDRQTDRWKEKEGGPIIWFHTLQDERGLCAPSLFKHTSRLSAPCNNNARTHTAACLTVRTITLLRGIDRGLKEQVKRMKCRKKKKKIDNWHIQSPGPAAHINPHKQIVAWLSCQRDRVG